MQKFGSNLCRLIDTIARQFGESVLLSTISLTLLIRNITEYLTVEIYILNVFPVHKAFLRYLVELGL